MFDVVTLSHMKALVTQLPPKVTLQGQLITIKKDLIACLS